VKRKHDNGFPSRDAIVGFIRANPGKIGTREIAREFGLKNADRVELKRILRELADDGAIAKRGRKIHEPAALPPTVIADITGRDTDGELLATPTEWDTEENGPAPKIRIHVPRRPQPGTAAGVGDRALMRIEKLDEGEGALYRGRVIKVIDHARTRVLGIFRKNPAGGGRLVPVDKKQAGRERRSAQLLDPERRRGQQLKRREEDGEREAAHDEEARREQPIGHEPRSIRGGGDRRYSRPAASGSDGGADGRSADSPRRRRRRCDGARQARLNRAGGRSVR